MAVDALLARSAGVRVSDAGEAWTADVSLGELEVRLAKPLTFMNRSGSAVERLLDQASLSLADLVVVLDDVALDLGTLRVRERGGHGGHNGLRSVIDVLGTEEFPRVRIGVKRGDPPADLAEYVLSEFPPDEVLIVQEAVGAAADAVACLLREGAAVAMNRYNTHAPA
jgi:PTH1 family peptidyl-tRNA hydrolase